MVSYCMPAYNKLIPLYIDGDTIYIRLYGDEHNKRAETLEGYTIISQEGVWYYADFDSDGFLIPSEYKLSKTNGDKTCQFLKKIQKHLTPINNPLVLERHNSISRNTVANNTIGTRRMLVVLMQYSDLPMIKNQNDFDELFNGKNYSKDGAIGSVSEYYADVSYGQLHLLCDVIGPFTSKYGMKYYGANDMRGDDINPLALFKEAMTYAATKVSLKDYDSNDDGIVDNIHIIFAGHGEEAGASDNTIWSYAATLYQPYELQGMIIERYSCAPELRGKDGNGISRIGPHCHEIGHVLGAKDYYDTNYSTGDTYLGTGQWDIMASGSWNEDGIIPADFNPYVKFNNFGWVTPKELPYGDVMISPSYIDVENYYILHSQNSADHYLLENRSKIKWGGGIPGEGLLLYHIHPDLANSGNAINTTSPQKCYIVCASSRIQLPGSTPSSYGAINSDGCPYPGRYNNTDFGSSSTPLAFFWDNNGCDIELNQISMNDDGIIHLRNNSIGNDDGILEREILFFEGFENNNINVDINVEDGDFTPHWIVKSNPQEELKFIERPSAYQGVRSLQLSAKGVSSQITSTLTFNISSDLTQDGRLMLKLYVNSLNPQVGNPNTIKIGYRTSEQEPLMYKEFQSSENNRWQQIITDLPNNILPQIILTGTAYTGSVLAIDNIEVEQEIIKEETKIDIAFSELDDCSFIYSLAGQKLLQLQRGINIVKDKNGRIYKIMQK